MHCLRAQALDEGEAHLGHCRGTVEAAFLFHLHNEMLECLFLVFRELKGVEDDVVAFHELGRRKTHWYVGSQRMVFDEVHDAMKATMHRTAVVVFVAEGMQITRQKIQRKKTFRDCSIHWPEWP